MKRLNMSIVSIFCPFPGQPAPLIAEDVYDIIMKNKDRLNSAIIYDRDFDYDYFGFKTLEKSYLLKMNGKVSRQEPLASNDIISLDFFSKCVIH